MSTPYYQDDSVTLYHGDSLEVLRTLPDQSVDCCVTSPPYFGLRDYGEPGQIGAESHPLEYVTRMREMFAEVRRVLADDGTLWLNIGDTYSAKRPYQVKQSRAKGAERGEAFDTTSFLPAKSLMLIPHRVAIALQDDGWILRQEIIWSKRSCMPERVDDRPSRTHEAVFLFTKSARYWYDADAIRYESDPEQVAHNERYAKVYAAQADRAATTGQPGNNNSAGIHARPGKPGRNAPSVWHLSMSPFPEAHFATMPQELARRCVVAGCKPGGVVLDPFSGSGTTGLVAGQTGRRYVGIDLSRDYLDLSLRTRLAQAALIDTEAAS